MREPIRYRNFCLVQWFALLLSQILYQFTDSGVFHIIRSLLMLCVVISIFNYRGIMDKYINQGDYKKIIRYQTENGCYKAAKVIGCVQGIVVSCTEFNEPFLKRYVDFNSELGFNREKSHWNVSQNTKMPHYFIGYDKNNDIVVVNTIPDNISSFACGKGAKGTYDSSPNGHLKLTICFMGGEKSYFENAVFGAAVQHCAYLCKKYKLKADAIVSDMEAFKLEFASRHTEFEEWMSAYGKTMDDFRDAVKARLKGR